MKKTAFLLVLFFLSQTGISQNTDYVVGISVGNNRMLYVGVKNIVTIVVSELSPADYEVRSQSDISIKNLGSGKYEIIPNSPGLISIEIFNKKDQTSLGSYQFFGAKLPSPVATVAFRNGGIIDKKMLIAQPQLRVVYLNTPVKADFSVVSFVLEIKNNNTIKSLQTAGNKFSEAQIKLIQEAPTDSRITIKDIKVKNKKGKELTLEPVIFLLK